MPSESRMTCAALSLRHPSSSLASCSARRMSWASWMRAAVNADSFEQWLGLMATTDQEGGSVRDGESIVAAMQRSGRSLSTSSDSLRLGLMLTLERRPEEPAARRLFSETRRQASAAALALYRRVYGERLSDEELRSLARLAVAIVDGLFIAREAVEIADTSDMDAAFEMAGRAIIATAERLASRSAV